ncbi:dual specificity protein phosphatase family protein [Paenibacillus sp. LHD-117]|uniref:protein-tyrosine phosphatase family protein n=1 Tax=Paenibacillus sp. LHD-117 TaxID=3071412 RepID=UPI0027E02CFF|nr:dual specificity protein phosphatase family protein [Paenibacillus sp. LHD-117]MDQ6418367.1 dual specificity protein phosphatase family protein [Paenibacillus sp. LHD-117]
MQKNYHNLIDDKIFFGGAADVEDMFKNEGIEIVVDLRGEATECAFPNENLKWIQVPLGDNAEEPQDQLFKQAVSHVVESYRSGKKVGFHCGGGSGRTGAVAVGTLIELGKSHSIEEAETLAKSIRPKVNVKSPHREALQKLYL